MPPVFSTHRHRHSMACQIAWLITIRLCSTLIGFARLVSFESGVSSLFRVVDEAALAVVVARSGRSVRGASDSGQTDVGAVGCSSGMWCYTGNGAGVLSTLQAVHDRVYKVVSRRDSSAVRR